MSLINEALKKAQRQRHQPPADSTAGSGGAPAQPVPKRAAPMRAQSVLIAFAGAAVLVVLSVVITVYLVNRPPPTLSTPAPVAVKPSSVDLNAPSLVVVAPVPSVPTSPVSDSPAPTAAAASATPPAAPAGPVASSTSIAIPSTALPARRPAELPETRPPGKPASTPASTVASAPATEPAPAPAAIENRPLPGAASAALASPDPRIASFVDGIRVTGIRSSGNESKVLMNDRVYRVNDIVERTLGVKLIEVAPEALTFSDANGVIYKKFF